MVSKKTTTIHDHGSGPHVHPGTPAEGSPSRKEKLIIRLERYVQHNLEHAELLERMAEEAERWSGLETGSLRILGPSPVRRFAGGAFARRNGKSVDLPERESALWKERPYRITLEVVRRRKRIRPV
jgi:hypothetical protein